MSRRAGNVSIKQLNANTTTDESGTTTTTISGPSVVNDVDDVETVITTMINNDTILDADDVNGLIDVKLVDYATKTLLSNELDNYTSKELLTQSLSEKANYTTTDALNATATNHENRIKGLEDNFVSTTRLNELLKDKANLSHTHTLSEITDYAAYDDSNCAKLNSNNTFTGIITATNLKSDNETRLATCEKAFSSYQTALSNLENNLSSHTHTISQITDYTPTDLSNVEEDINELTEQVLAIEESLNGVALSTHTHSINQITDLQTTLDGKASSSHSHLIGDLKYDSSNTLKSVIDGKASSSHSHTLSQITDYAAYDDSNCAKLNAANTFTDNQTITKNLTVDNILTVGNKIELNGDTFEQFRADGYNFRYYIGRNKTDSFLIEYHYSNIQADEYVYIGLSENSAFKFIYNKTQSLLPLESSYNISCPSITLNGTDLATTLGGKASSSHSHLIGDLKYDSSNTLKSVIDGKASTSHNHSINQITNLQTTLNGKASSSHTHLIGDLKYDSSNTLKSVIDGKALSSHNHSISDITNLQTTLNGKASSSHSHLIADLNYDSSNTLKSVIDGKASSSHTHSNYASTTHTHTLSQITDYTAPDLSNCAKTNAANTFTAAQTINGSLTVKNGSTDNLYHFNVFAHNLASGRHVFARFGHSDNDSSSDTIESVMFRFRYYSNASATKSNFGIRLAGQEDTLTIYESSMDISKPLSVPSISLNGTDLATTLNGKASSSHSHLIGDLKYDSSNTLKSVIDGKASSSHNHDGTYAKLSAANTFNNTLTASKFNSSNTTAASALGTNLQKAIIDLVFKEIYPVGSIYTTSTVPTSMPNYTLYNNSKPRFTQHGCTFELLPSKYFLRNCQWTIKENEPGVYAFSTNDDAASTSGSSTHSHDLGANGYALISLQSNTRYIYSVPFTSFVQTKNPLENKFSSDTQTVGTFNYRPTMLGGRTEINTADDQEPLNSHVWMWKRVA